MPTKHQHFASPHIHDIASLPSLSLLPTVRQGHRGKMWSTLDGSTARLYDRWSSGDNAKRCHSSGELFASSTELSICTISHRSSVLIATGSRYLNVISPVPRDVHFQHLGWPLPQGEHRFCYIICRYGLPIHRRTSCVPRLPLPSVWYWDHKP
jgi:hypothetical protein